MRSSIAMNYLTVEECSRRVLALPTSFLAITLARCERWASLVGGRVFAVWQDVLGTLHVVGGFTHKGLDRIKSVSRVKVADLGGVSVLLELLLKERGGGEVPGKRSEVTVGIRFGSKDNANWGVVADA